MTKCSKLLGYIAIFMTISCANLNNDNIRFAPIHNGINKELSQHIRTFMNKNAKYSKIWKKYQLTAGFYSFSGSTAGACYNFGPKIREISIDPDTWDILSPAERWALIYHELVHCLCNRGHTYRGGIYRNFKKNKTEFAGYFSDGCATSIMHPQMQTKYCILKHKDHYLQEMMEDCNP